jgi:hypothetical protein
VVHTPSAHEADAASSLVGHDAPAVDLFFVDPPRTVKGLDERRLEGADFKGCKASHHGLFCQARQTREVRSRARDIPRGRTIAAASVTTRAGQGERPRFARASK